MNTYENTYENTYDYLIVGSGIAGLYAALLARERRSRWSVR